MLDVSLPTDSYKRLRIRVEVRPTRLIFIPETNHRFPRSVQVLKSTVGPDVLHTIIMLPGLFWLINKALKKGLQIT